ncbi:MAG: SIR2 family NAD-dependent protein deacylase [Acidimicrobiales bacterium]
MSSEQESTSDSQSPDNQSPDIGSTDAALESAVLEAAGLIEGAERVTVLTGAGISTDSRIPDFRGPQGVWTKNPGAEKQATIQNYMADPEVRRRSWMSRLDSPVWGAEPNPGHMAVLRLEARRRMHLLITQNVDGLHHAAGSNPDRIVEVHGNVREVICMSCDYSDPMQVALDRVRQGDHDPACPRCGGILKSATISFGQNLVMEDIERANEAAATCDLLLAVGSTLAVFPIARAVPIAKTAGAKIIIVNGSPTEMDGLADVVVNGSISEVLPRIVG